MLSENVSKGIAPMEMGLTFSPTAKNMSANLKMALEADTGHIHLSMVENT